MSFADLLDVIRQDLRRNNDDYEESTISQIPASSEPPKASVTTEILPIATKTMKTIKSFKSPNLLKTSDLKVTKNTESTERSSPYRRIFISSEILPMRDKPKHRPIKIDPSQFMVTISNIPETDSKRRTPFTRIYDTDGIISKNNIEQFDRKTSHQKTKLSTVRKETKADDGNEELNKIKQKLYEGTKDNLQTEVTTNTGTQATKMKTQMIKKVPQKMGLVMSEIHDQPLVPSLRVTAKTTTENPSVEDLLAPWEVSLLETTKGVINRIKDFSEMQWRATESEEKKKPEKKNSILSKINKKKYENRTRLNNTKIQTKYMLRAKTMKHNYDLNRIEALKLKLREGLKMSSLPPGDLLDMWPARGPIVHAMRLRVSSNCTGFDLNLKSIPRP